MGASGLRGVLKLRVYGSQVGRREKVTTPRNPVRLTGGQARLLPADWAPGGHRRPEELPWPSRERLAKVPSYDPEAAWTSPRLAGCAYPPSTTRRPGPSALPAGTPIRISQSYRVGPSGRNGI